MAKTFWVATYQEIHDAEKLAAYAELALPAITAAGGRFIARGMPAAIREGGKMERTVIVEFDSLEAALAAYESPAYEEALAKLGDGVTRDIRLVEAS